MNEEINAWLNSSRQYDEGLSLYEKYGSSATQKRLLRKSGPTRKTIAVLAYELGKLSKVPAPKAAIKKPVQISKPVEIKKTAPDQHGGLVPKIEYSGLRQNTPEVDELLRHIKGLHKLVSNISSSLPYLSSDEERLQKAMIILDTSEEIDGSYDRLRIYDKTGILPADTKKPSKEKIPLNQMGIQDLMIQQSNLRSKISKCKKKEVTGKKLSTRAGNTRKRELYELELAEIVEKLKR